MYCWYSSEVPQRDTSYDDDEFRFNSEATHEGHLHQNGILTWFGIEMAIIITSHIWMKI